MKWVNNYYSTTGKWWGPAEAAVRECDKEWAKLVQKFCHAANSKVLELGAGYGGAAVATAKLGFDVTAIELSDRIDFISKIEGGAKVTAVKGDFYETNFDTKFGCVAYWDGFGVGTDTENRILLKRIAAEWLEDDGITLIEVYNPIVWASWNGDTETKEAKPEEGYNYSIKQLQQFDPVNCRFVDSWHELDKPDEVVTQNVRCYSPADFALLVEGTGLKIEQMFCGETELSLGDNFVSFEPLLKTEWKYLVVLRRS